MINLLDVIHDDENHLEPVYVHRIAARPALRPGWLARQTGRALQASGARLVQIGKRLASPKLPAAELKTAG